MAKQCVLSVTIQGRLPESSKYFIGNRGVKVVGGKKPSATLESPEAVDP